MLCLTVDASISVAIYVLFGNIYISQSEVDWVPLFVMYLVSEPVRHTPTGYDSRHTLLVTDQCAARSKITTFLKNRMVVFFSANRASQLQPLHLGNIRAFTCNYRKRFISQTAT
jgi:hypothetical protein